MTRTPAAPRVRRRRSLLDNAARAILIRLDELTAFDTYVAQEEAVAQHHEMRIAAKRLRYTLEIFQEAYERYTPHGDAYEEMIDVVKTLQEQLGDLHDADVLAPELSAQILGLVSAGRERSHPPVWTPGVHHVDFEACQGLLTLCRETRSARDRRYAEFVANWQRLQAEQRFAAWRKLLLDCRSEQERLEFASLPDEIARDAKIEDAAHEC